MPAEPHAELTARELLAALDDEVARLPERYRLPLLLAYWQGLTLDQAAACLGWSAGSVKGRLERGRRALAERLRRRGVAPEAILAVPSVKAPAGLAASATAVATGQVAAPAAVLALAAPPAKLLPLAALAVLLAGAGAWQLAGGPAPADPPPAAPAPPAVRVDADGDPLPDGAVRRFGSTRFRHGDTIYSFAVAPGGRTFATAGSGSVRLLDAATGRRLAVFAGLGSHTNALQFSRDGARLLVAGAADADRKRGRVALWDIAAGPLTTIDYPSWVRHATLTPDGRAILVQCDDGTIELRDATTGAVTRSLAPAAGGHPQAALAVDGRRFAEWRWDQSVRVQEAETGATVFRTGALQGVCNLALSPAGSTLAVATWRGPNVEPVVRVFDVATGRELGTAPAEKGMPPSFAFTPDGKVLAVGGTGGSVRLWDAGTVKPVREIGVDDRYVYGMAFAPDGGTLYTAGTGGAVRAWSVTTGLQCGGATGPRTGAGLALSPDGRTLATGGDEGQLHLWNRAAASHRAKLVAHGGIVTDVRFSPDGKTMASSGTDGTVRLWNGTTGFPVRVIEAVEKEQNLRPAFSPDGKTLAVGGVGEVRLYTPPDAKEPRTLRGIEGYVTDLAFSADGANIAAAFQMMGGLTVWSTASSDKLFRADGLYPSSPAFTADGRGILWLDGSKARAHDFRTGVERPAPGWDDVQTLALSPDRTRLATAHRGGRLAVRDAATGRELLTRCTEADVVYRLVWSADATRLFAAYGDGTVLEWDIALPR